MLRHEERAERVKTQEEERPRMCRVAVFEVKTEEAPKSTRENFVWPEFKCDRDRIKHNSKVFKSKPLNEIFGCPTAKELNVPITPEVGQTIKVKIASITKDLVTFDGISTKESIICKNNLCKYKNINYKDREIDALVIDVNKSKQTVTVDVLQPMFDKWVNGILQDKTVQYDVENPKIVLVKDLKLSGGGYLGKALVQPISDFVGEQYFVDAFVPGSQIVLNLESDFERWNGESIPTFVTNYITKPVSNTQPRLICSRKSVLTYSGNLAKIEIYKQYCESSTGWKKFSKHKNDGIVTGVINSSKKCGVFVEIPSLNITGMVTTKPEELVNYKAGQEVKVHITDFEKMTVYDETTKTTTHLIPYEIEDNKLKSCILKPILEFA